MKKKSLLLLCAALLSLSSCTAQKVEEENASPFFRIEGELPDIGEYSGKAQAKYHEKAGEEFVPDESYGTLLPFIERVKVFSGNEFGFGASVAYPSVGLCTENGQIVVSPFDGSVSYNGYYKEFPHYQLMHDSDEDWGMRASASTVISVDGKTKIDLSAGSYICGAGDGIITVLVADDDSYQFSKAVCYDYDGNILFEIDGVWSIGSYCSGYANIQTGTDERSACYVDTKGNIVSDMYQYCSAFNENGIAYVIETENKAYLIDKNFDRISDIYRAVYIYNDDYFTARDEEFTHVISSDGKIVSTVWDTSYISIHESADDFIYSYYDGEHEIYKKLDGSLLLNENGDAPNTYTEARGYYATVDEDKNQTVFDSSGRIVAVLENCDSVAQVLDGEKLIVYLKGSYQYDGFTDGMPNYIDPIRTVIYDAENKKELYVLNGQGGTTVVGNGKYLHMSNYNDHAFDGATKYHLFDIEKREFIFSDCIAINCYEIDGRSYYCVCDENFCTLYDQDLKKIIRFINE